MYRPLPAFKPGCLGDSQSPMQFIYPQGNAVINLPRQLDGSTSSVTFELAHNDSETTVFWHLDNEFVTATRDLHKVSMQPPEGRHSVTVVDSEGNRLSIAITVK